MVVPSAIRKAALDGDTAAIEKWFSTGNRDPDERDQFGHTLLGCAAATGHCDVMRLLIAHGADVNPPHVPTSIVKSTILHQAAYYGRHEVAVFLLDHGAQIDARTGGADTPLMWAAESDRCGMTRLLLSRGADLDARDNDGRDAEAFARLRINNKQEAAALLAEVRRAGDWHAYLRVPRKRLLALRVLCERGRASTDDALLRRLFPTHAPVEDDEPALRARAAAQGPRELPKEVFWLVFEFWRSDRDSRY